MFSDCISFNSISTLWCCCFYFSKRREDFFHCHRHPKQLLMGTAHTFGLTSDLITIVCPRCTNSNQLYTTTVCWATTQGSESLSFQLLMISVRMGTTMTVSNELVMCWPCSLLYIQRKCERNNSVRSWRTWAGTAYSRKAQAVRRKSSQWSSGD